MTKMGLTAACYSRCSTDMQDVSIEGQEELHQRTASRFGLHITRKFADEGISGEGRLDRVGLDALITAALNHEFDAIIVEDVDRLSRDEETTHWALKRIRHAEIKLFSQHGEMSDMEVSVKGFMAAHHNKQLRDKIRRGIHRAADKGLCPGAVTYGYQRVEKETNIYDPGVRAVYEVEAGVVRRIFREYDAGISPRDICVGLTRDGILSPGGANRWNPQTLIGASYGKGMLGNRIYVGEITWNTHRSTKHPATERVIRRPLPEAEWIVRSAPHLRIIEQDLWDRVQARRRQRAQRKFGPSGKPGRRTDVVHRGNHLLSGLFRCSACGDSMRVVQIDRKGHSRIACAKARTFRQCEHSKSYDIEELTKLTLEKLKVLLTDRDTMLVGLEEARRHFAVVAKSSSAKAGEIGRELTNVKVKIDRIVKSILDGTSSPTLERALSELEVKRADLEQQQRRATTTNVTTLPNLAEQWLKTTNNLYELLCQGEDTPDLRSGLRSFLGWIDVKATGKRMPYEIEAFRKLDAMFHANLFPERRTNEEIIETERLFNNGSVALAAKQDLPSCRKRHSDPEPQRSRVVSLGIWRQAA